MMAAEGLMSDRDGKKPGEAVGLVVTGVFEMATEGLRAHVDAKYRLRLGAN